MEFIADNFIWIILVLVIILMTVIGYIADKTDFGKNKVEKPVKEKKIKEKKVKEKKHKKEAVVEEIADINEEELPKNDIDPINDFPMETNENEELVAQAFDTDEMDLSPRVDDFMNESNDTQVDEIAPVPTVEPVMDTQEEENDLETSFEMPDLKDEEVIQEETPAIDEEKVNNELLGNQKDDLEIELPSIDTLNKELEEDSEDDDVWKF